MGLYNRDYYRNTDHGDTWGLEGLTPVVGVDITIPKGLFPTQDTASSRRASRRPRSAATITS